MDYSRARPRALKAAKFSWGWMH